MGSVKTLMDRELRDRETDVLLLYWAGHGYAHQGKKERRLYFADSDALNQSLSLDELLELLASEKFDFRALFAFVDCCATMKTAHQLPAAQISEACHGRRAAEQYVHFACSLGEAASYKDMGLFSKELFEELEKCQLPLDVAKLDSSLSTRFEKLRCAGQNPMRYWAKNTAGGTTAWDAGLSDTTIIKNYFLSLKKDWMHHPSFTEDVLPLTQKPGHIRELPAFLARELEALSPNLRQMAPPVIISPDPSSPAVRLEDYLAKHRRIVLLGNPGSGKTTLLRQLAIYLMDGNTAGMPEALRGRVPLLAELRNWHDRTTTLEGFLQDEARRLNVPLLAEKIHQLIGEGRAVLLLDGLDQMPGYSMKHVGKAEDKRLEEIRKIRQKEFDKTLCVVTCRVKDFQGGPQWHDLHIWPLNDREILDFALASDFDEGKAENFLTWLEHATLRGRPLRELAGQPYYVKKFLAFYYRKTETGVFMADRGEHPDLLRYTVDDALDILCDKEQLNTSKLKRLRQQLDLLAFRMTWAKVLQLEDRDEAIAWLLESDIHTPGTIGQQLAAVGLDDVSLIKTIEGAPLLTIEQRIEGDRALGLASKSGLVLDNGVRIEFEHQLTQEFLTLSYCAKRGLDQELLATAAQTQFREVWRQWVARDSTLLDRVLGFLESRFDLLTRTHAAFVLGLLENQRAVPQLVKVLTLQKYDLDYGLLKKTSARALGQIADHRATAMLITLLADPKERDMVKEEAAWALGLIKDTSATPALIEALRYDPDVGVRAAWSLGQIGGAWAIEALVEKFEEGNSELTLAASHALIHIGAPAVQPIVQSLSRIGIHIGMVDAIRALGAVGDSTARAALHQILRKLNREKRGAERGVTTMRPSYMTIAQYINMIKMILKEVNEAMANISGTKKSVIT